VADKLQGKRLAFIGGGTIAEAMIRGLLERHLVPPSHVAATGPRRERRADLAKRFGVKAAEGLAPSHPTLGDVDSHEALEHYQAQKRAHKASLRART
jgi:predicted dehydrogenase